MTRPFLSHVITDDSALGGSVIERSLRFNYSDTANLTRTSSSASTTFTYSAWIKRSHQAGNYRYIFSMGNRGFAFHSSNRTFYLYDGSSLNESTSKYRDECGWYHVVVQINSGVATSYINGVLVHNAVGSGFTLTTGSNETRIGMHQPGYYYWHGYMAEINLVDGSVVAPTEFGFTDSQTGIWMPKRYEGAYGTNGFHLEFKDNSSTSALGTDTSGNGNDFTTNNFSVSAGTGNDSLIDTPTNNFPTLNPLRHDPFSLTNYVSPTFSNGNLTFATNTTSNVNYAESTMYFPKSGKWYIETTVSNVNIGSGVGYAQISVDGDTGGSRYLWWHYASSYYEINTDSGLQTIGSISNDDIIQVAYDADTSNLWFGKNNSWYLSGDPSSATPMSSATTVVSDNTKFFVGGRTGSGQNIMHVNFGQRPFNYTPPTGFKALCSKNLPPNVPSIIRPQKHFDTLLYTGDGATVHEVTGLEFQPDMVWVKSRSQSSSNHGLTDSVRTDPSYPANHTMLYTNLTNSETGGGNYFALTTASGRDPFLKDGFVLNNNSSGNNNGSTYVAWCWKAGGAAVSNSDGSIASQVSANTEAGFSIVTWTGNGSDGATVGHGLGAKPDWIIIKKRANNSGGNTGNWIVQHKSLSNGVNANTSTFTLTSYSSSAIYLSLTNGESSYGFDNQVNGNTDTFVAYCWHEVPGYSKFGSYLGDGTSDGQYVHLGFRPAWVMIKQTNSTAGWMMYDSERSPLNQINKYLQANYANAEVDSTTDNPIDFLSDGMKMRYSNSATNSSSGSYIYMAFAEQPGTTPFDTSPNAR